VKLVIEAFFVQVLQIRKSAELNLHILSFTYFTVARIVSFLNLNHITSGVYFGQSLTPLPQVSTNKVSLQESPVNIIS
jgi:hypothetical protein